MFTVKKNDVWSSNHRINPGNEEQQAMTASKRIYPMPVERVDFLYGSYTQGSNLYFLLR